jgi:hypothetical protein
MHSLEMTSKLSYAVHHSSTDKLDVFPLSVAGIFIKDGTNNSSHYLSSFKATKLQAIFLKTT